MKRAQKTIPVGKYIVSLEHSAGFALEALDARARAKLCVWIEVRTFFLICSVGVCSDDSGGPFLWVIKVKRLGDILYGAQDGIYSNSAPA